MKQENLQLKKLKIEAYPLIEATSVLSNLPQILMAALGNQRYVEAILALIKNILTARTALYRVKEWAKEIEPSLIGNINLNDDVMGRALDKLFTADRASLQAKITIAAIKNFSIAVDAIHNDSTSVAFCGDYGAQNKSALLLKRGHSKDHRPDLKQLILSLSVSADGAVPIHFKSYDGNISDDTTHKESWTSIRGLLAKSDFIYVADSKLCTEDNMRFIDSNQGLFITIVPRTRGETATFAEKAYRGEIRWASLWRKKKSRKENEIDHYEISEGFYQLREGYRVFWYRSSQKVRRDYEYRNNLIETAMEKLELLQREKRRGPKTKAALEKAAISIVNRYKVSGWINIDIKITEEAVFKKSSRGKPGANTVYKRVLGKKYELIILKNPEGIARSQVMDGVFPLATNTKLDALKVLQHYKYQPRLEKRFSLLKSVCNVAPVFLKNNNRIEAMMFVYFISLLLAALLERRLRKEMEINGIKSIKSLPEERLSAAPTWEQIVRLFDGFARYQLVKSHKVVQIFNDKPSEIQKQVLSLLKLNAANAFY